jgi:hypothetical protein
VRAKLFTLLTLVAVVALLIPLASGKGQPTVARLAPATAGEVTVADIEAPAPAATGTAMPMLMARELRASVSVFRWVSVNTHPNGTRCNSKRPVQL